MSDFSKLSKKRTISVQKVRLYFLPVHTRVPLKFGNEVLTEVTCVRVCLSVIDQQGNRAEGWGETPLSVQWVWPDVLPYQQRLDALKQLCIDLAADWHDFDRMGHPIELGHHLIHHQLKERHAQSNMPWLAALVCNSAFDIALHDAYGNLHGCDVYQTYNDQYMQHDLSYYLEPASDSHVNFTGLYPQDFLLSMPIRKLPVWHMVGGKDPLEALELRSDEPDDGYPVLLTDWIQRDGLTCLKIKLSGHDSVLDYQRIVRVGKLGIENGVKFLTTELEQPLWTLAKHTFALPEDQRCDAIKQTAQWEFQRALKALQRRFDGQGWLVADEFSVADIFLAQTLSWAQMAGQPLPAVLEQWGEEVRARPACERARQREQQAAEERQQH